MKDWETIYTYTRKQAIDDGVQVRVPDELRKEAGIKYPVFVTQNVWDEYLSVPKEFEGYQDLDGRIWDMLFMFAMEARKISGDRLTFQVVVQIPKERKWQSNEKGDECYREVTLYAVIGAMDFDDPSPAVTIMKPGED
jgi:hypothetical protein